MRTLTRRAADTIRCLFGSPLRFCALLGLVELRCEILEVDNSEQPVGEHSKEDVERNEGKQDAKVPPALAVVDIDASQELVLV